MKSVTMTAATLALGLCAALPADANEFEASMRDYLEAEVLNWAFDPVLIDAVREQNARFAGLSQARIATLDTEWRNEVSSPVQPTIRPVLENPASDFLRARMAEASGIISEVFVMDEHGMNVAISGVTSDFWQGDEAKFLDTFHQGPGAVFVDEVEFDESSQTYVGQISVTLQDPDSGAPIGAITVSLNAEMLY